MLLFILLHRNIILIRRRKRERILVWIVFIKTRRKLGLHAQTLGTAFIRGAQADASGATKVLGRGGQAAAGGSWLSQILACGAEAVARGAVACASQVLDSAAEAAARGAARCASHILDRGAQAGA